MKSILTLTLIALSLTLSAQTKPKSAPIKIDSTKYTYFVKVSVQDFNSIWQLASMYKESIIYYPKVVDKTAEQINIDRFLMELSKRVSIDSLKIK